MSRPPARRRGRLVDPVAQGRRPRRRDRRARPGGPRGPPGRHRGRPGRLVAGARRRRSPRRGGLDDVAAIGVGGQQHGMVCLDEAGEVVRPALLWNDTRSAGAAADLIAELRRRGRRLGRRDRARAGGLFTVDQAALARRARAGQRRPDGRRLPAARLAHLAAGRCRRPARAAPPTAATPAARATGRRRPATYRPRPAAAARFGPRRWRVPRPCSARPRLGGRRPCRCPARRRAPATTRPPRSGSAPRPGDVVVSHRHLGHRLRRGGAAGRRRHRHRRRVRRRHRAVPAAGRAPSTRPGSSTPPPRCSASTWPTLAELALRRPPGAGGLVAACPTWRASAPPTGPTPPARCTACTLRQRHPGAPGPGGGRGHAVRARRRPRRAAWRRACAVERVLLIGGGAAVRGGTPDRTGRLRRAGHRAADPGEYVADGAARQAAWALTGALPQWRAEGAQTFDGPADPAVRSRYAHAREHVLERV